MEPMQTIIQTVYDYTTLLVAVMLVIQAVYFMRFLLSRASLAAIVMVLYTAALGFEYSRSVLAYLFEIKECGAETLCADIGRLTVLGCVSFVTLLIIRRRLGGRKP